MKEESGSFGAFGRPSKFNMATRHVIVLAALAMLCACVATAQEDTAGYWMVKANELLQNGSFEEASLAYEKALQIDPNNATIWHRQAFLLTTIGKENESIRAYERALSLLNESLAKNPQDAESWNMKGLVLMSLGRPGEGYQARLKALDLFNQTIEKDTLNASAWLSKAEILAFMGQNEEALKAYDKVIELEPGEYGVMNRKAEFLTILGRHNESIVAYDQAIERIPANDTLALGWMWGGKGSALYAAGRSEEVQRIAGCIQ